MKRLNSLGEGRRAGADLQVDPYRPDMQLMFESVAQFLKRTPTGTIHCTVGNKAVIGDLSSKSISAHLQGLPANVLLAATTWSGQIWISG